MNYEEMSDLQINLLVANAIGVDAAENSWVVFGAVRNEGGNVVSVIGVVDYCNNPSDAWPIIFENKIAIKPCATKRSSNKEWYATNLEKITSSSQENPLRAAMIVFLMMQEQSI